ncbi:molybdate ABC transporter substrate-binding protein [Aquipseudomonas ullengensis]|uniref:Molybdate ABC transporter substrate-binding protein n=1 Tax=Aquipseudomonas ullengensis TaxID=2759166 RepID=A0A7W4QCU3_9GAMM|nr:molybdate ABC transporter substrate-binding protein [Pseudomonas ullengensis]MBB2493848.1 molybdate ABC transporter substrate-binding protein [Pseudomonas ullengensis]
MRPLLQPLTLLALLSAPLAQAAEPVRIAVAANLLPLMEQLVQRYEQQSGAQVDIAGGSSGAFYEQIQRGAPFDLFYSADAERPEKLAAAGLSEAARPYACGRLALWTPHATPALNALPDGKVAIAQPDTAPYGKAALQTLENSGQLAAVKPRLVYAQDIGQAFQFVTSGNAPSGFVGLSQLMAANTPAGQYSQVDSALYAPLVQKRVLLAKGERKAAAEAFAQFFDAQQSSLKSAGYALPGEAGCAAD